MTAPKPLLALAALAAMAMLAGAAWLASPGKPPRHILLSNLSAAPITGEHATLAVFLKLKNTGGADRLLSVHSRHASASLLSPTRSQGLAIPARSSPALAADGAHIRLQNLTGPLSDGRLIPLTLSFQHAGDITAKARLSDPKTRGNATAYGLFGLGDICRVEAGEPAPKISLSAQPDGDGWQIQITAQEFSFSQDLLDGPHVPGTGHGHLYLNGLKLQRLYAPTAQIGALPSGRHRLRVTLNTNDHRAYLVGDTPVTAEVEIIQP